VLALRAKVEAIVDDRISEAAADVRVQTHDGRDLHIVIEHAIGSTQRPMSEAQLKAKFVDQSAPVLGQAKAEQSWALASCLAGCGDLGPLLAAATLI